MIFSVLFELSVSAVSAGDTVLVCRHEDTGSALGADGLGPDDLVALDLVGVLLRDDFLGCRCFCHSNHSWGASSADASGLVASIPFLFSRYSLSNSSAASLLS